MWISLVEADDERRGQGAYRPDAKKRGLSLAFLSSAADAAR
jgi:hypothetical protein